MGLAGGGRVVAAGWWLVAGLWLWLWAVALGVAVGLWVVLVGKCGIGVE